MDPDSEPIEEVEGSCHSIYEASYQEIERNQNPLLRASKIAKRIKFDRRIDMKERKHLKSRYNIIIFRLR